MGSSLSNAKVEIDTRRIREIVSEAIETFSDQYTLALKHCVFQKIKLSSPASAIRSLPLHELWGKERSGSSALKAPPLHDWDYAIKRGDMMKVRKVFKIKLI